MKHVAVLAAGVVLVLAGWFALRPGQRHASADVAHVSAAAPLNTDSIPEQPDTALEARLRRLADRAPGRCAIVAKNLRTGAIARVNADERLPLLSLVKLPVALVVLDGVDRGRWTLDTPITLLPQDMHPRGWIGDRFPHGGGPVSLYRLLHEMLTRSDNSAADALMRVAGGPAAVTAWLQAREIRDLSVDRSERGLGDDWYGLAPGADTMASAEAIRELRAQVPAAVHDSAARAMLRDPRDTGTAEACVVLLERLWQGKLLSPTATDTLKSVLAACRTAPHRLPAMLPRGTPVARKSGTGGTSAGVTLAINDVGVMRLPNGDEVAIAVLIGETRGRVQRAELVIARVARTVFDAWSTGGEDRPRVPA